MNMMQIVAAVVALVMALIAAVESPGNGAEKKALVVGKAAELMAILPLPVWAKFTFGNRLVLGVLVDLLVGVLNKIGWPTTAAAESVLGG